MSYLVKASLAMFKELPFVSYLDKTLMLPEHEQPQQSAEVDSNKKMSLLFILNAHNCFDALK